MKMSKWVSRVAIVGIVGLITAVIVLGFSVSQWVYKAEEASRRAEILAEEVFTMRLSLRQWVDKAEEASSKAEMLAEEVFTLQRLLKEKDIIEESPPPKDIIIPECPDKGKYLDPEEGYYLPYYYEVLVRFKDEVTHEEKTALFKELGFEGGWKLLFPRSGNTYLLRLFRLPAGVTVSEVVEKLDQQEEVECTLLICPRLREIFTPPAYMRGEVLVRFKEEVTYEERTALIETLGFEIAEVVVMTLICDIYVIRIPAGVTLSEAIEKLNQQEEVKHAQRNYILRLRG